MILRQGDYGNSVAGLQFGLNNYGAYGLQADGNFDSYTTDALCKFQEANGMTVTGVADDAVLEALRPYVPGDYLEYVYPG